MTAPVPDGWILSELTVDSPEGLHARPAIKVSRFARKFSSAIQIRPRGQEKWIDAKSVAKVMLLQATCGAVIELRALGEDAQVAISSLRQFFASDFAEPDAEAG